MTVIDKSRFCWRSRNWNRPIKISDVTSRSRSCFLRGNNFFMTLSHCYCFHHSFGPFLPLSNSHCFIVIPLVFFIFLRWETATSLIVPSHCYICPWHPLPKVLHQTAQTQQTFICLKRDYSHALVLLRRFSLALGRCKIVSHNWIYLNEFLNHLSQCMVYPILLCFDHWKKIIDSTLLRPGIDGSMY